jgi:hypothetical protein
MMGTGMMRAARGGWRARDYLLTGVAVVLVAGFAGALLAWRPWRTRAKHRKARQDRRSCGRHSGGGAGVVLPHDGNRERARAQA